LFLLTFIYIKHFCFMAQAIKVEVQLNQDADAGLKRAKQRLVAIRDSEKVTFCCYVFASYGGSRPNKNGQSELRGASELLTTDGRSISFGYFANPRATSISDSKIDPTTADAIDYGVPSEVVSACTGINASTNEERNNRYLVNCGCPSAYRFDGTLNAPTPIVATMRRTTTGAIGGNDANLGLREWYWLEVSPEATKAKRDAMAAAIKATDATKPAEAADIAKIKAAIGNFTALDRLNAAQAAAWLAIL
jgi:hypothetical protein